MEWANFIHLNNEDTTPLKNIFFAMYDTYLLKVSNLAVLEVMEGGGFKLLERAPGVSVEEIINSTEGSLLVEGEIPEMQF